MPKIRVNINGKEIETYSGHTILEVAEQNGISIPTLCHDDKLKSYGSCGMCVVEVENNPKLIRSCSTQIQDGMVVKTQTDRVIESRKTTLELMLSDHKGDCKAPCMLGCPSNVDVQGYVGLTANEEYEEALKLIKEDLPFPASIGRVCPHPCQTDCRRGIVDDAISIAWIKRFVADMDLEKEDTYMPSMKANTSKNVAIIGGGPGGLSAAYFLRRAGHNVTVYEAMPEFGGMLQYGIPMYRLPKDVLKKEVEVIEAMGVELRPNMKIGRDIELEDIMSIFDATYVSIGAWKSSPMRVTGNDAKGVIGGIDFLRKFTLNQPVKIGNKVAVVGGGNTAMDACRTAVRLGAKEVYVIYRRTKQDMPADDVEIEEAEEEGVVFKFLTNPAEFVKDSENNIRQVRLTKMVQGEPDASGRRSVSPSGEEEIIDVDSVILAIGQKLAPEGLEAIALNDWGNMISETNTFRTNLEGVFAGGDAVNKGAGIAIQAIADGKNAAKVMDKYLQGETISIQPLYTVKKENMTLADFDTIVPEKRAYMGHVSPEVRKHNFEEIVDGYVPVDAVKEANRCLECGCMDSPECDLFEYANNYDVNPERFVSITEELPMDTAHPYFIRDSNKCILCGMCVRVCDEVMDQGILGFSSRGFDAVVKPAFDQTFEETDCISCGQCVTICPVGALQEKVLINKPVPVEAEITDSVCGRCGLGCQVTLETKGSLLLRSLPKKTKDINEGLLCEKGRFDLVVAQNMDRLTKPLIRKNGVLTEVSFDEAIMFAARKAQSISMRYGSEAMAAVVPGAYTNESAFMMQKLCKESLRTENVYAERGYEKGIDSILGYDASTNAVKELDQTDLILAVGTNLMETQPILGTRIKKATNHGTTFVSINNRFDRSDRWSDEIYKTDQSMTLISGIMKVLTTEMGQPKNTSGFDVLKNSLEGVSVSEDAIKIANMLMATKNVMFVIDRDNLTDEAVLLLAQMAVVSGHIGRPRNGIIQLRADGNNQGLVDLGIKINTCELAKKINDNKIKGLMVMNSTIKIEDDVKFDFLMVQEKNLSALGERADVVFPAITHAEVSGTMTTQDRKIQKLNDAIKSKVACSNVDLFSSMMAVLGTTVDTENIFDAITLQVPEYNQGNDPLWKSNVLYEKGYNTEDGRAKLRASECGDMYKTIEEVGYYKCVEEITV